MSDSRSSGILMAVSSLPGPYGIGSLGAGAYAFVDFLARAGQRYWQILPLVPPGDGASPYMSPSAFAGNPWFIDLDQLVEEGLLTRQEADTARWDAPDRVDYGWLARTRMPLLRRAWERSRTLPSPADAPQLDWLEDYAAFAALHEQLGSGWQRWGADAVPDPERMDFHRFVQTTFYRQWFALKKYANAKGVRIMGDIPIYLSADSVEMWKQPELFHLDGDGRLKAVAGVPPDAFSEDGQLWGNPLYDWQGNREGVFAFWRRRMDWCARLYDAVRIDHFRAFHTYWSVPLGAASAKQGRWLPGPGMELLDALRQAQPQLELIAEDLGVLTDDVKALRDASGYPGMKVLGFAFDSREPSDYLPHTYEKNTVCYTGTHDNMTMRQWLETAPEDAREYAMEYMNLSEREGLVWGTVRTAMASTSDVCIVLMQDILDLPGTARMNFPGTQSDDNWTWRAEKDYINDALAAKL